MLEELVMITAQATFGVTQVLTVSTTRIMHLILLHLAQEEICSNRIIITMSNIQTQLQRSIMDVLKGLIHVQ